ncbi:hypothetical protein CBR59_09575 [Bacillus thuringiensis]|nr:hypothetical protein CBP87_05985 [Bacillus thuringiensis]PNK57534.1 hypothetical protein CBR59_09575 [Bacillus thuringiensis]
METDLVSLSRGIFYCSVTVYPALTGSKTPTSKFSESEEVRWGDQLPVKARLVQLIISGG